MNDNVYVGDDGLSDDPEGDCEGRAPDVVVNEFGACTGGLKQAASDDLAALVAEFTAHGGQIQHVANGVSAHADEYHIFGNYYPATTDRLVTRILRAANHELAKPGMVTLSHIAVVADAPAKHVLGVIEAYMKENEKARQLVAHELAKRGLKK